MYDSWTSLGLQPDVCWIPTRRPFDDFFQIVNLQISFFFLVRTFKKIHRSNENLYKEKFSERFSTNLNCGQVATGNGY